MFQKFAFLLSILQLINVLTLSQSEKVSSPLTSSHHSAFNSLADMGLILPETFNEEFPSPIFYEGVIPLVLQYTIPKWNMDDFLLEDYKRQCSVESGNSNMVKGNSYSAPYGCYIMNPLRQITEKLTPIHSPEFRKSTSDQQPFETLTSATVRQIMRDPSFCKAIKNHFNSDWVKADGLKEYLDNLSKVCNFYNGGSAKIEKPSSTYNVNLQEHYKRIDSNMVSYLYSNIHNHNSWVGGGIVIAAKIGNQAMMLANYYEEKERWFRAKEDCRAGHIPSSLVPIQNFTSSLKSVDSSLTRTGNKLSIPTNNVLQYYSNPLTECTSTSETFVVRVLVPVTRKETSDNLKLVRITPIPFLYDGKVCQVRLDGTKNDDDTFSESKSKFYLYQKSLGKAYPTSCKPNQLCNLSPPLEDQKSDSCASFLLLRNKTEDIGAHCDITCDSKESSKLPRVVRVAANKIVLSGDVNPLQFSCKGGQGVNKRVVHVKPIKAGTKLITLNCQCQLILSNSVYGDELCELSSSNLYIPEFTVYPAIPQMLSKLHSIHGNDDHGTRNLQFADVLTFFNLTEVADKGKLEKLIKATEKKMQTPEMIFRSFYVQDKDKLENQIENTYADKNVVIIQFTIIVVIVFGFIGSIIYMQIRINKIEGRFSTWASVNSSRSSGRCQMMESCSGLQTDSILFKAGEENVYSGVL